MAHPPQLVECLRESLPDAEPAAKLAKRGEDAEGMLTVENDRCGSNFDIKCFGVHLTCWLRSLYRPPAVRCALLRAIATTHSNHP